MVHLNGFLISPFSVAPVRLCHGSWSNLPFAFVKVLPLIISALLLWLQIRCLWFCTFWQLLISARQKLGLVWFWFEILVNLTKRLRDYCYWDLIERNLANLDNIQPTVKCDVTWIWTGSKTEILVTVIHQTIDLLASSVHMDLKSANLYCSSKDELEG